MRFDVKDINELIRRDAVSFIAGCDEAYYRKVATAADVIVRNMKQSPIILLAGPSGSTKTTTAQNIAKELEARGIRAHKISLDDYFKTLNRETAPKTAEGEIDYESPQLLDMSLLAEHFNALKEGREILVPHFDFKSQSRLEDAGQLLSVGKDEVVIFEGIHALNDDFALHSPEALGLFVTVRAKYIYNSEPVLESESCRLMRRLVRDNNFRGTGAGETLATWDNVCLGERKYIAPFKNRADYLLDTGLPYEVSVLACTMRRPK